jgi:hypothetical protein
MMSTGKSSTVPRRANALRRATLRFYVVTTKYALQDWILEALAARDGSATLLDVADAIWTEHEHDLRAAGDLFLTWQYDMRWAATALRRDGRIRAATDSPRGVWELA